MENDHSHSSEYLELFDVFQAQILIYHSIIYPKYHLAKRANFNISDLLSI